MSDGPSRRSRLARYATRPRWGLAYWRARRASLADRGRHQPLADRPVHPPAEALALATGRDRGECEAALEQAWLAPPVVGDSAEWWPRRELSRILGALTALTAARTVVEVGVARGYGSAAILHALRAREDARLHSIDLPPLEADAGFVGSVVPPKLRASWDLVLGPSRTELPRLLEWIPPPGLFVHDGDHSYESQREDLEAVWPRLEPGGIAAVDDVWTPAVFDFAAAAGAGVVLARGFDERDAIALVAKSPSASVPA